jgi:hypothetical protein
MRKFLEYAVTEGKTVLSGPELTRRFSDIDGRLHVLEELKVGWEAAVLQVQNHGLERINNVLQPLLDQARAEIDAVSATLVEILATWQGDRAAILTGWQAVQDGWADLAGDFATLQAQAAEHEARLTALADQVAGLDLQPRALGGLLEDEQTPAENDVALGAVRFPAGGAVAWGHFAAWRDGAAWRFQMEAMMATAEATEVSLEAWYQVFSPGMVMNPVKRRWRAGTVYNLGDLRLPTIPNGRRYRMSSGSGGWSTDLCTGGVILSGGDHAGYPKALAFDDNPVNPSGWISSQQGAAVSGAAWVGYQFSTAQDVRRIALVGTGDARHFVSSAKAQCADNPAGPWTDVAPITIAQAEGAPQTFDLPEAGSHTCWRLVAQTNTTEYGWYVYEIEMLKPLTTTGTSGAVEPAWPTETGQSVADGSVLWVCDGPGMARLALPTNPPSIAFDRFNLNSADLQIPAGEVAAGDRVHFALVRRGDAHPGDLIVNELWLAPVEA